MVSGSTFHQKPQPLCPALTPPASQVRRFLDLCDAEPRLAVHCRAGLGRTGTLIALWLMRRAGFSARAAIAWLRVVRPGCVLGRQQRYLCACERRGWGDGNALRPRDSEGRSYSCRESAASARGGAAGGTGEGPAGPSTRPQDHDAVGLSCLSMGKADGALSCGAAASLAAEFTAAMSARGAARVAGGFGSRSSACVGSRLGRCV